MTNDYYAILGFISEQPVEVREKIHFYVVQLEEFIEQDQPAAMLALALIGSKYGEK